MQVRGKALQVTVKLVHFTPAAMLRDLLQNVAISSFIAGLLTSTNGVTLAAAVLLAELLLCKLPDEYRRCPFTQHVDFFKGHVLNGASPHSRCCLLHGSSGGVILAAAVLLVNALFCNCLMRPFLEWLCAVCSRPIHRGQGNEI